MGWASTANNHWSDGFPFSEVYLAAGGDGGYNKSGGEWPVFGKIDGIKVVMKSGIYWDMRLVYPWVIKFGWEIP